MNTKKTILVIAVIFLLNGSHKKNIGKQKGKINKRYICIRKSHSERYSKGKGFSDGNIRQY